VDVSTTSALAIIGAISTPVVAIAAEVYNHVRAERDRAVVRDLARDAQTHDRETRRNDEEHAQTIRRGDRAYEARKDVYRRIMRRSPVAGRRRARRADGAIRGLRGDAATARAAG
jgi:hypothetical protein